MAKERSNPPKANILMESMRSMGYTFESAIADVIDNSIGAGAHNVTLLFPTLPEKCFVAICDDGRGMDSKELFEAMRYGSEAPSEIRSQGDLGRFGIGLKSASLSQCKKLTVISKKNGKLSAFIWDLNLITCDDWKILELDQKEISRIDIVDWLSDYDNGTIVLWEDFDVILRTTGDVFTTLDSYKTTCSNYISLIFHRFINDKEVTFKINNYTVKGLDPFLEKHPKTTIRKKIETPLTNSYGEEVMITVTPYVLPFSKDLSKKDMELVGGYDKLRTNQGFYIYRNKRLIIYGTWFGSAPKNELTKNARIKVDIPNSVDDIWSIDIRKQHASIPKVISNQLRKAVDEAMGLAVKSQKHRGRIENIDEEYTYIWNRVEDRGKYIYKINRESAAFDFLKDIEIDSDLAARIDMMIKQIEDTIPYQQIYIDMSANNVAQEDEKARSKEILADARYLVSLQKNIAPESVKEFIQLLFQKEPYCKYIDLKEIIENEY